MKKTEIIKSEREEVIDVLCDSCGESCRVELCLPLEGEDPKDVPHNFEYMRLKSAWGYGSDHDCETWEAHVCQKCVDDKLGFINFKKTNYL